MSLPPEALPRRELELKLRQSRVLNMILGVVAIVAVVFGAVLLSQGENGGEKRATSAESDHGSADSKSQEGASPDSGKNTAAAGIDRRIEGDPMALGDIDAPIVMSEWVDFRCPFCAVFSRDTFDKIVKEYVDTGKVRIEVHDVAFFGEESIRAAAAARAAGEQGRYFEFVKAVYDAAPENGHPDLPAEELIGFAKTAGVPDIEKFTKDMARDDLRAAVNQSTEQAHQYGVSSVPMFVSKDKAIAGAQSIDEFRKFLSQASTATQ